MKPRIFWGKIAKLSLTDDCVNNPVNLLWIIQNLYYNKKNWRHLRFLVWFFTLRKVRKGLIKGAWDRRFFKIFAS